MNLTRNHILSYKREIREIYEENSIPLPEEYYFPTPPEIDNNYMATLKQKQRVQRLRRREINLTEKRQSTTWSNKVCFEIKEE